MYERIVKIVIVKNSLDIELDNNYYLTKINDIGDLPQDTIDIINIKKCDLKKNKEVLLRIDFKEISKKQYKKILKKLLALKNKYYKKNLRFGIENGSKILLGYIINYDETNKEQNDFILAINAIFYDTKYERYSYIYDTVCNYLDSVFYGKNVCDFKNNKCGEKCNTDSVIGCCRHYKYKLFGPLLSNNLIPLIPCENLKEDGRCGIKCIGCKLFTCDYLERKGIKFKIKDILLLNTFFTPRQKYIIKFMVYTPKEKVIEKLI